MPKLQDTYGTCVECGSAYKRSSSPMQELCPNCAHHLYGYENCVHQMQDGACIHCGWQGKVSDFIISLINSNGPDKS